jgi:hypothetical protein
MITTTTTTTTIIIIIIIIIMSYEAKENCIQNLQFGRDVKRVHDKVT